MRTKIFFLLFASAFILGSCTKEEIELTAEQRIEQITNKYVLYGRTPGIIVGTIKDGDIRIYSYGVADLETGALIDENTVFEIGSVTKTFTAVLYADFINSGLLNLNDTVNNLVSEDLHLPDKDNIPIKIVHLLTHTSGLEREPDDFSYDDPSSYTQTQLSAFLKRTSLRTLPGTECYYSNLGMGFAGYILTFISDSTYSQLVQSRIFTPLGMNSSYCNAEQKPETNIAKGYAGSGVKDFIYFNDFFAGAGVIKSTMNDMLIYLDNCINSESSVIGSEIDLALTPTFNITEKNDIGLSWFLGVNDKNQTVAFHDGGTPGFSSFVGINRTNKTGVVVLINSYCLGEQDMIGLEIMDILDEQ